MPSKFNDHEITNLRNIIAELNREIVKNKEQELSVKSDFLSLNNDLNNLREELVLNSTKLNEAKIQAVEASKAKSEFLTLLSHEFRTPLHGILGMTEILSMSSLTKEQRESVCVINKSAQLLLYLINDILDCSKLEAGEMKLNLTEMDIRTIISDVHALLSVKAVKAGNKLYTEIDETLSRHLLGDTARLTQIFVNLVGNAIKFTKEGTIHTRIKVLSSTDEVQKIRIEVSDTGIGIAKEDQLGLFKPYAQTLDGQQSKYGGTGLGLSISKYFVELMGGKIGLISDYGQGSTFWVEVTLEVTDCPEELIPAAESSSDTLATGVLETSEPLESISFDQPILVAEDNEINRKVILVQLEKLGITNVDVVDNGEKAVEAYLQKPYGLILMDYMMPKLNGLEATKKIRQIERDEMRVRTSIIALTGNATESQRQECLDAGMDDYLSKPIPLHTLNEMIQQWNSLQQDYRILNDEVISELFSLGNEERNENLLITLLQMYKKDTPGKISQLIHDFHCLEYGKVTQTAHDLKSSSLNLGIEYFSILVGQIEVSAREERMDDIAEIIDLLKPAYEEACCEMEKLLIPSK